MSGIYKIPSRGFLPESDNVRAEAMENAVKYIESKLAPATGVVEVLAVFVLGIIVGIWIIGPLL